ncbi:uncharacterized protein [Rutidosis leptorrhynchoides]|uniref:uncharacterized protein n=1 Tax=Rutidosis leptorrhynchoides TaxID=125765 RepID=UPI003A99663A
MHCFSLFQKSCSFFATSRLQKYQLRSTRSMKREWLICILTWYTMHTLLRRSSDPPYIVTPADVSTAVRTGASVVSHPLVSTFVDASNAGSSSCIAAQRACFCKSAALHSLDAAVA